MKKNLLLVSAFCLVTLFSLFPVYSQDNESSNFSMGADVVSRYVWRGINLGGSSPHVQPFMEYSFGESGLSIGAWASYSLGLGVAGTEADLYISYSPTDWLNITLNDYFFPTDEPFERNDYFNYKSDETSHTYEAMLTLGGSESLPFYLTFAMNLYGADGVNEKGDNYNAKYLELGYNGTLKSYDFSAFAGLALDDPKTDQGGAGWYGDKAGLINLGVTMAKEYKIADVSLPVFSSLIFNPEAGNIYLVLGISF
jgi:uncharacterized protein (TIGR02001 family)